MSDRTNSILIADLGRILGVYSTSENNGKYPGTGIIFRGYGKWDLFSDKVGSIIVFDSVTIALANQSLKRRILFALSRAEITDYNESAIFSIIKSARKQSHGTTILIMEDALSGAERLADANRAILIDAVQVTEKNILSLSAIDGAMIIDTEGNCYAIGAILDGVAIKPGNIARGARYNSAITYVDYWLGEGYKAVAIIVSSDDSVDLYPDESFSREPIKKRRGTFSNG